MLNTVGMENREDRPHQGSQPIFIGGSGRCGTSIMIFLLNCHPEIMAYAEPHGFYRYFIDYRVNKNIPGWVFSPLYASRMTPRLIQSVKVMSGGFSADPARYFTRTRFVKSLIRAGKDTTGENRLRRFGLFAENFLGEYARRCEKSRWCMKIPLELMENIDRLYVMHPDMRFIHMVRDGKDVIASMMDQQWDGGKIKEFSYALNFWQSAMHKGMEKMSSVPTSNILSVRLEDLVDDPEGEIERICHFTGIDFDQRLKEYYQANFFDGHIGRWKEKLNERQVNQIHEAGGDILEKYGYA